MKALFKLFLWLIGLSVAVIAAAVVAVPMFLDPNDHKQRIVDLVEQQTGRKLDLAGDIQLSVFPWLGLDLGPTTLGNAAGFGEQPFVKTERVKVHVALLPLLRKEVQMDTVSLQGASIHLVRNKDGRTNWDDLVVAPGDEAPKTEQGPALQLAGLALNGLEIQDADLVWDDQQEGLRYVIQDFNLETQRLVMGEPIDLSLAFRLQESSQGITGDVALDALVGYDVQEQRYALRPIDLSTRLKGATLPGGAMDLDLKGQIQVDLAAATATVSGLSIQAMGTKITGDLNAARILGPFPLIDGALKIEASDVASLLQALGQDPASIPLKALVMSTNLSSTTDTLIIEGLSAKATLAGAQIPQGPVDVVLSTNAVVNVQAQTLTVDQLRLQGLGLDLQGAFKGASIFDNPRIGGQLQLSIASVPDLLRALGQDPSGVPVGSLTMKTRLGMTKELVKLTNLTARAVVQGGDLPAGPVDVVAAQALVNLNKQTLALDNLSVKGNGIDMLVSVNGSQVIDAPQFSGTIKLAPLNLRTLLGQLGQEVPVTADPKVLQSVAVSSNFTASKKDLALKGLVMQLDESTIRGDVAVTDFKSQAVTFNLNVDHINADRYLPPKAADAKPAPVTPGTAAGAAATGLPLDTLRSLNANGQLRVGSLTIDELKLDNVNLNLNARDGDIKLHPVSAQLFGGSYNGNVGLDATGAQPRLSVDSTVKDMQAGPVLEHFTGQSRIDGTANADVKLAAVGADPDAIKRSLNGNISFDFRDGAIKGFNIAQVLRGIQTKLTGNLLATSSGPLQTDFSELVGDMTIENGVITNTRLSAKSPLLRVEGNGKVNLISEAIDYSIKSTLVGTLKGQDGNELGDLKGIPIPIRVTGTFGDLKFIPDIKSLVEARARLELEKQKEKLEAKLQEELQDKLGGAIGEKLRDAVGGQVGDALGGELGGQLGDAMGGQLGDAVGGLLGAPKKQPAAPAADQEEPVEAVPPVDQATEQLRKLLPF